MQEFDFVIIGSGFGGSVAAMRLTQKGYKVLVLEKGRRFKKSDFPKTNWNLPKFFWAPMIRCFGIQQISLLKGVMVLHGSGVGGGSLVYANTLMEPRSAAFKQSSWPAGVDWESLLKPYYQIAKKMLGVAVNQLESSTDLELKKLGGTLGCEGSYHLTEVGVYFGDPQKRGEEVPDPYFNGDGPSRAGCTGCGGCMVGCRVGAKNTLDQNYLYFAEKWGAQVLEKQFVERVIPVETLKSHQWEEWGLGGNSQPKPSSNYIVETFEVGSFLGGAFKRRRQFFATKNVIFSAGVIGTVELLFKQKYKYQTLPKISDQLGEGVRTNGESLCGVTSFEKHREYSRGIAIGSAIHVDENTKIEPVRYSVGSSVMRFLAVPLTDDGNFLIRPLKLIWQILRKFPDFWKLLTIKDWANQSIILLVMQSLDQKMNLKWKRSFWRMGIPGLSGDAGEVPSFMPIAQNATKLLSSQIHGIPQNSTSEVLLKTPATAHILGGAIIGHSAEVAVADLRHEIFGYKGLYVCDGSHIPANLGVNPSLTITAMSERFADQFPSLNSIQKEIRFTNER